MSGIKNDTPSIQEALCIPFGAAGTDDGLNRSCQMTLEQPVVPSGDLGM